MKISTSFGTAHPYQYNLDRLKKEGQELRDHVAALGLYLAHGWMEMVGMEHKDGCGCKCCRRAMEILNLCGTITLRRSRYPEIPSGAEYEPGSVTVKPMGIDIEYCESEEVALQWAVNRITDELERRQR